MDVFKIIQPVSWAERNSPLPPSPVPESFEPDDEFRIIYITEHGWLAVPDNQSELYFGLSKSIRCLFFLVRKSDIQQLRLDFIEG